MNRLRPGTNSCTDVYTSLCLSSLSVLYKRKELKNRHRNNNSNETI